METFIDKSENEIFIEMVNSDVVAYHDKREVGRLQFAEIDCDKGHSFIKLMYMDVKSDYRNAGIATRMMEMAVEYHGDFSRPLLNAVGGYHVASEEYYTEEGADFIQHCIDKKILPPDPDESDIEEDEYEY